jgi:hypothetical protein
MGERHAVDLLIARGYAATTLPTNFPTYDIEASRNGSTFFVSVKVSRDKQHVRLGSRSSVERLSEGNFVFAFLPKPGLAITDLDPAQYTLLILPATLAKNDGLRVHDAYWAEKGNAQEYSVMVKGYGKHHKAIWPIWMTYADAWRQLP